MSKYVKQLTFLENYREAEMCSGYEPKLPAAAQRVKVVKNLHRDLFP